MSRQLIAMKDFTKGYNDTADPDMLEDNELLKATNIDLSEKGGWSSRPGTVKFSVENFSGEVSDGFEWIVNNESRKLIVANKSLYWITDTTSTEKIHLYSLHSDKVGWLAINKKLYIGDGSEIYVWGDYDYDEIEGTVDVVTFDIVKTSEGYFYQFKGMIDTVDLTTVDYSTSDWQNVTDVQGVISSVVRPIKAYDPSVKEVVKMQITNPVKQAGDIKIILDGTEYLITVTGAKEKLTYSLSGTATAGAISIVLNDNVYNLQVFADESATTVAGRIASYSYDGYTVSASNAAITFEAIECGEKGTHNFDGGNTGISCSINMVTEGFAETEENIVTTIAADFPDDVRANKWDASITGSKEITFMATTSGAKKDAYFDPNGTGVGASMTVDIQGKENTCDLTPIKKCTMFVMNPENLRVFASGNPDDPTAVYFSEYNHFEHFKSTSVLYPNTAEKEVRGMTVLLDHVLVSYTNVWYHWKGIDPDDAVWKPLPILTGAINHYCIAVTPFSITYVSDYGLHNVNAGILYQDAVVINNTRLFKNLAEGRFTKLIKNIKNPKNAKMIYEKEKLYLAYSDDESNTSNNKVLVYKWNTQGVSIYDGWQVNKWLPTFDGELLFCTKNYVLKTGKGYSDIDVDTGLAKAIAYEVETKDYDLKNPFAIKFLYNFFVAFQQDDDVEPKVDVTLIGDYKTQDIAFQDVSAIDSFVWGRTWGLKWGWVNAIVKRFQINGKALRYRINFYCDLLNSPVTCYGVGFDYEQVNAPIPLTGDEGRLLT